MPNDPIKPVINIDEVDLMDFAHGETFAAKLGRIGSAIGADQIGCMLTVVEPGKRAFPFHVHHNNEEMFIILEGEGEYRFGEKTYPLRTGDIATAPAGGKEYAHQIVNTGTGTLRYLGLSTKKQPEVVEYPDSGKFLVASQMEDGSPMTAKLRFIGRSDQTLDYWDGEPE